MEIAAYFGRCSEKFGYEGKQRNESLSERVYKSKCFKNCVCVSSRL